MSHLPEVSNSSLLAAYRNEVKVPLDRGQYVGFRQNLYQLGLYPTVAFPDRRISSVYYDTSDFSDYFDNISGDANRSKTRIRWYNGDTSRLTLELKIKHNKASRKEALRLENPQGADPRTREGLVDVLSGAARASERLMLQRLQPTLEVEYERQYYTLDADLRMTIDLGQKFRRLYPTPMAEMRSSPVFAVVEFKYPAAKSAVMKVLMRNLPERVFRHSKYVIGMECTAP